MCKTINTSQIIDSIQKQTHKISYFLKSISDKEKLTFYLLSEKQLILAFKNYSCQLIFAQTIQTLSVSEIYEFIYYEQFYYFSLHGQHFEQRLQLIWFHSINIQIPSEKKLLFPRMIKNSSLNLTTSSSTSQTYAFSHNKSQKFHTSQPRKYAKKVNNYRISYCPDQLLGKSLYGEVRLGYHEQKMKVVAFTINSMPLSATTRKNLELQKKMAKIKDCVCQIEEVIEKKRYRYTGYQYFPKTFETQLENFQKSTKLLDQYLQKFLLIYAKLYYLRVTHGNLTLSNVGITFDGKVKLMDFRATDLPFQDAAQADYFAFREMICMIMLRTKIFPEKLQCLDEVDGNWERLFSLWHVFHPYQYIYVHKRNYFQNIVILLHNLENSIKQCLIENSEHIRIALRCLILQYLYKLAEKQKQKAMKQIYRLRYLLSSLFEILSQKEVSDLVSYYNSLLWDVMSDPEYFGLTHSHKLALLSCFVEDLNHEYLCVQILKQFDQAIIYMRIDGKSEKLLQPQELQVIRNNQMNEILANNLFGVYNTEIKNGLLNRKIFSEIDELCQVPCQLSGLNLSVFSGINSSLDSKKFITTQTIFEKNLRIQFLKNKNNTSMKISSPKYPFTPTYRAFRKNSSLNQSKNTQQSSFKY